MSNLLVQNIKHTNGTTAQTIDSSGRVSTPVRVGFSGKEPRPHNSSTYVITNDVNLYFNTAYHNSGHFVNSTASGQGEFTCPVGGAYLLQANFLIDNNAGASDLCRYSWFLNGTEKYTGYDNDRSSAGRYEAMGSAGGVLICSANDVITIQVSDGSFHSASESHATIYYLG